VTEALNRTAEALVGAESEIRAIVLDEAPTTIVEAYQVQRAATKLRVESGRIASGYKIGMTGVSARRLFNIDVPIYGRLFEDMAISDGEKLQRSGFNAPRVEVELAFIIQGKPSPVRHWTDAIAAIEWVIPALEIIDSRVMPSSSSMPVPTIEDVVADNSGAAALILGNSAFRPESLDLSRVPALMFKNSVIEDSGVSTAVFGNPVRALAWLIGMLEESGEALEAGDLVLSGSLTQPLPFERGDNLVAEYGGLGSVKLSVV